MNVEFLTNKIREIVHASVRFLRHYLKEIIVALVLAFVAAVLIDWYRDRNKQLALEANVRASATLAVYDEQHHEIKQGTGVFVRSDGVLVTAYHVIRGAADVEARLRSHAYYHLKRPGGILAVDEKTDIAVLQFDGETPAVPNVGDSDKVQIGDQVYAIGAPEGLEATVSRGNISNPFRKLSDRLFIQFTAPISPGSSGGGLFDETGDVIGITAEVVEAKEGQNLNLAVPANAFRNVLQGRSEGISTESPELYYSLGNLADSREEWDKAIEYYKKAIELNGSYANAYINLGGDYFEKGQFDLEVLAYRNAAIADPKNREAFYCLATAYEDVGNYDDAVAAYKTALAIDPNYKDALHDLSIAYLANGQVEDAKKLLPRLKAVNVGWGNEIEKLVHRIERSP